MALISPKYFNNLILLFQFFSSWILIRSASQKSYNNPPFLFDYLYFIYYPYSYAKSTFFDIKMLLSISNKKAEIAFPYHSRVSPFQLNLIYFLLTTKLYIPLHMLTIPVALTYPNASNTKSKESKCLPTINIRTV